ncbi:hypothetical protein [Flavobacterium sp. GCM10027622]|uniref:hypothetical protein n=1 Tax=unclassified Flavobacterium TaxID=196869 RepID=UPI003613F14D
MRASFPFFVLLVCFTSCHQNSKEQKDVLRTSSALPTDTLQKRMTFNRISEVVQDSTYSIWVDKQKENFSLALHFQSKDTLSISYSPECWLMYPYQLQNEKLIVYWDNNIDTKYNFDIVQAIDDTDEKLIGKPFMTLELENDTTFKAHYLIEGLIEKINRSNKDRILFPEQFNLVQDGEMYD